MSIRELIDPIPAAGGACTLTGLKHWQQGRALYGGASALIAYTAAIRAFPDLPPLRAAQIAFVSPTDADIELRREIVRRGRNVAQVRSEIWNAKGCVLSAYFLFGEAREANGRHTAPPADSLASAPEEADEVMSGKGPAFIQANFELRRAQELRGKGKPVVRRWARLTDREGLDPISELVLLGDVMPPGAMRAMERPGPISSINWSFNLLGTEPTTTDGWWLSENASTHADNGYSSERLRLWNADGRQVMDGLQSVAIFG